MMPTYTQTNLPVDFKPAGRCEEAEGRRFERIGWREDYAAVVEAVFEGGWGGCAADGEVPFEEVCFEGRGVVVWGRGGGEFGGFFEDAFDGGGFGGELAGGGHDWWWWWCGVFGRVGLLGRGLVCLAVMSPRSCC